MCFYFICTWGSGWAGGSATCSTGTQSPGQTWNENTSFRRIDSFNIFSGLNVSFLFLCCLAPTKMSVEIWVTLPSPSTHLERSVKISSECFVSRGTLVQARLWHSVPLCCTSVLLDDNSVVAHPLLSDQCFEVIQHSGSHSHSSTWRGQSSLAEADVKGIFNTV